LPNRSESARHSRPAGCGRKAVAIMESLHGSCLLARQLQAPLVYLKTGEASRPKVNRRLAVRISKRTRAARSHRASVQPPLRQANTRSRSQGEPSVIKHCHSSSYEPAALHGSGQVPPALQRSRSKNHIHVNPCLTSTYAYSVKKVQEMEVFFLSGGLLVQLYIRLCGNRGQDKGGSLLVGGTNSQR